MRWFPAPCWSAARSLPRSLLSPAESRSATTPFLPGLWPEARSLRWLQTRQAGVEWLARTPGAAAHPAVITNVHIHAAAVSEHLWAMCLALTRRLGSAILQQEKQAWDRDSLVRGISTLEGKTACILGLGVIGRRCARLARAFGMRVIGIRRQPGSTDLEPGVVDEVGGPADLLDALARSRVVMAVLPETAATRGLIGRPEMQAMKGAYLLNAGRGSCLDTDALVEALRAGQVRGAGLDVTDPEPLPQGHPLWAMPECHHHPPLCGRSPRVLQGSIRGLPRQPGQVHARRAPGECRGQGARLLTLPGGAGLRYPSLMAAGATTGGGEASAGARILIGTSGYSYDDWVGPVYPEGTPKSEFLPFYARQFPVVELNFSYYQQPGARVLGAMVEATPDGFLFALKAHRSMTHEITETWEKDIAAFREGIRPLIEARRLAAVLLQFPYSFGYTPESRVRLADLCARLEGLPLAVEFRKSDWMQQRVREGLRERGVALVSVDEPRLPRLPEPSAEITAISRTSVFTAGMPPTGGRATMPAATTTCTPATSSRSGRSA